MLIAICVATGCSKSKDNTKIKIQQAASSNSIVAYPQQMATHLEQIATSFPQVQSANVVLLGKVAIVGLNVKPDLPRSQVDNLKYSVAEALHKDPNGANAVVTADMDMNQRIKNIRQAVMNGRPISGFTNELGTIIGRIVPQVPAK